MAYDLVRYTKGAGTFVDTDNEQVAVDTLLEEYLEDSEYAFVLFENDDLGGEPTHIVLYDVVYKLVEVEASPSLSKDGE